MVSSLMMITLTFMNVSFAIINIDSSPLIAIFNSFVGGMSFMVLLSNIIDWRLK